MMRTIIEVALNGSTSTSRNPNVPKAPDEVAADGIACIEAGAALLHNHIEDPFLEGTDAANRYAAGWRAILRRHQDAIVCPTMASSSDIGARTSHYRDCVLLHGARMLPLDPGSMNMMLSGGEVGAVTSFAYINDVSHVGDTLKLMRELQVGASLGIYEPGFLRLAVAHWRAGTLPAGSVAKLYFFGGRNIFDGLPCAGFGLEPTRSALDAYLEIIGDSGMPWMVAVIGGCVASTGMADMAIARGGHVRVGLEDYAGDRAPANVDLVRRVATIAERHGRPAASCAQAAEILGLPPAVRKVSVSAEPRLDEDV